MWKIKMTVIQIVISDFRIEQKNLEKKDVNLEIIRRIETITAPLKSTKIPRRVVEICEILLSLKQP